MPETELKFSVEPARSPAVGLALARAGAVDRRIDSYQFDTPDGRLSRAGITLRLRVVGGEWEQTLKAPGDVAGVRLEETVLLPDERSDGVPAVRLVRHAGTPGGDALRRVLHEGEADATEAALTCVSRTSVRRRSLVSRLADGRVEIAFDEGEIEARGRTERILEVEYELLSGSASAIVPLARAGVLEHGMYLASTSKSVRGARLAGVDGPMAPVKARVPALERTMNGGELLRRMVGACLDQILPNLDRVASGTSEPAHIHQLRVGLRRLRTAVRELEALDFSIPTALDDAVAGVFRDLGSVRDLTGVAAELEKRLAKAGSPSPVLVRRDPNRSAARDPARIVRDPAVQCALIDAIGFVLSDGPGFEVDAEEAGRLIAHRLARLRKQLRQGARRFKHLDDAERHRLRKRLKRLRYLAELTAPLWKRGRLRAFVAALEPAQDALGAYADLLVGLRLAQGDARNDTETDGKAAAFNLRWLRAAKAKAGHRCHRALALASKATPFWT